MNPVCRKFYAKDVGAALLRLLRMFDKAPHADVHENADADHGREQ
jgi:hypothetical protein